MRFTDPQKWISRKEIAELIGVSYRTVAGSEGSWGISLLRVVINKRYIVFPRKETVTQLKQKFPALKL